MTIIEIIMENTNLNPEVSQENPPFTLPLLLKSLADCVYKQEEMRLELADSTREVNHMIRLLDWSLRYFHSFEGLQDSEICNKIESEVEKNDILFAYTYYLSVCENFNYNWSYLQKQKEGYVKFLFHFYVYLTKVVACLNQLYARLKDFQDLILDFHGFLKVQFAGNSENEVRYMVEWSQFNKVHAVEKEFYVTAWCGHCALCCWCENRRIKDKQDIATMTDTISRLYHSIKTSSDRKEDKK